MGSWQRAAQRHNNHDRPEGASHPGPTQMSPAYQAVRNADFILSCVRIELLDDAVEGALMPYPGDEAFKKMRGERRDVFVHRSRGESIALIPLAADARVDDLRKLPTNEYLGVIRALISYRLPALLPDLELRWRQFEHERVMRQFDFLDRAFEQAKIKRPRACAGLHKFPRTGLTIQIVRLPSREAALGMTVRLRQRYEIEPSVRELLDRRFDLRGCWIYDPASDANERWIGRVTGVTGRYVVVDGEQGVRHVDPNRYRVEARQETVRDLLAQFLRPAELDAIERAEQQLLASVFTGEGYLRKLFRYAKELENRGVLEGAPSMRFQFAGLLDAESQVHVQRLPPTRYCFNPDRSAIHTTPSAGLEQYGPFQRCNDTPRILVVHPQEAKDEIKTFVDHLLHGHVSSRGPLRRGFLRTFGFTDAELQWAPVAYVQGASAEALRYRRAIEGVWDPSRRPDIAVVFLRSDTDEAAPVGPYIVTKAHLLMNGVPSQEVRLNTTRSHETQLPYIFENLAIAMHAKLGGTPWTVFSADSRVREIVLGMAHAEVGSRFAARKRYMGITTVFSNDGSFWLAASSGRCAYEEYPAALSRSVAEVLTHLKEEQAWRSGDRVRLIVHTHKPLKNTDIASVIQVATRELSEDIRFEAACLTVHRDHPWKVVEPRQNGRSRNAGASTVASNMPAKGERVPLRGTVVHLGARQRLLCLKDGLLMLRPTDPMPQPLRLELHKQSTYDKMDPLTKQVLDFAGLSWRSSRCIFEPVTTYYAHVIADMLNRLSTVEGWSDPVLDTQLARSRWFL